MPYLPHLVSTELPREEGFSQLAMKILIAMHTSILRGCPTNGIDPRRLLPLPLPLPASPFFLPIHQKRNRVLRPLDASQALRNSSTRTSRHPTWHPPAISDHTLTNIHMMTIQIIRDIALPPGPRLKRFQLRLGLAHVAIKIVAIPQPLCPMPGIRISRIKPLMMLDTDENPVLPTCPKQLKMMTQQLRRWLRDQNMMPPLHRIHRNREMHTIRRENRNTTPARQGIDGALISIRIRRVIRGVRGK